MEEFTEKTYVAFILDKSGSMQSVKKIIVSGFNEYIQTIHKNAGKGGETFVSLVLFDGEVNTEFFNSSVNSLQELKEEMYKPSGSTAMYDAVGATLARFSEETNISDMNNSYLVIIISDGEENASKHWNSPKLAERIQELQATDRWTFTYVGCNQNLAEVQKKLGLEAGNVYKGWIGDDATSLQQMADGNICLDVFYTEREAGEKSTKDFYNQKT